MPSKGAAVRSEQLATLGRIAHEKFTTSAMGKLLDGLRPYEESLPFDSDEASLIRVTRRDYEKAVKVPGELRAQMTRVGSMSTEAWIEARKQSKITGLQPFLTYDGARASPQTPKAIP